MLRRSWIAVLLIIIPGFALAQSAIPTPDEFVGYKLGDRFTPYNRILDYFDELAKRSNLITVQRFGASYEGRPLVLATITSAKNRANLEAIRQNVASFANADTLDAAKAADIARGTPAVVWLA